jgi:hypothetical protein
MYIFNRSVTQQVPAQQLIPAAPAMQSMCGLWGTPHVHMQRGSSFVTITLD